jgi:hypothetical protein
LRNNIYQCVNICGPNPVCGAAAGLCYGGGCPDGRSCITINSKWQCVDRGVPGSCIQDICNRETCKSLETCCVYKQIGTSAGDCSNVYPHPLLCGEDQTPKGLIEVARCN